MGVRENIEADVYDELPYPRKPTLPGLLSKRAKDLTQTDLDELPAVAKQHALDTVAYEADMKAYNEDRAFKHKRFESDLATENEVTLHKHRKKVFDMAWEDEHGGGLTSVLYAYERLVELLH